MMEWIYNEKRNNILIVLFLLYYHSSYAQQLIPDINFGNSGHITTPGTSEINEVVPLNNGNILSIGTMIGNSNNSVQIMRFLPNGILDTGFGYNGIVSTPVGIFQDMGLELALQSNGKILALGTFQDYQLGPYYSFVVRYHSDGTLDTSFGLNGVLRLYYGSDNALGSISVLADDKILLSGCVYTGSGNHFALARLTPDGALDNTFGVNGWVVTTFNDPSCIFDHVILSDGKIVVCGYEGIWNWGVGQGSDFAIARYQYNGVLDSSFGDNGSRRIDINPQSTDVASHITLLGNSHLLLTGYSADALAAVQFQPNGDLDSTFGQFGLSIFSQLPVPTSANLLPDGKVLITGIKNLAPYDAGFTFVKLNVDGSLDSTFGIQGMSTSNISTGADYVQDAVLVNNSTLLCAGSSESENLLAQYILTTPNDLEDKEYADNWIKLFPNPATQHRITIEYSLSRPQKVSVNILDVSGKIVKKICPHIKQSAGRHRTEIDVTGFAEGYYFLFFQGEEHTSVQKMAIIR